MKLPTKPGNFVKKCARNNATVACLWGVYIRNCRKISSFWVPRLHTAPVGMKFSMGESTPSRKILPQFWNLLTYWTKNLKITPEYLNTGVCAARIVPVIIETITIDLNIYTVFQKSDAKIEITITTINLIRISELNILLAASIAFLAQTLQISTKSTAQFLSNRCLKSGTQKQKFPIWKSRLSSSYTITSVTVCAQSGRRLHRHMRVVKYATIELLGQ